MQPHRVLHQDGGALDVQLIRPPSFRQRGDGDPSGPFVDVLAPARIGPHVGVVPLGIRLAFERPRSGCTSSRLREDNGWQIEAVTPYPWCGGCVTATACQ
jgi:hypothetical protein